MESLESDTDEKRASLLSTLKSTLHYKKYMIRKKIISIVFYY